MTQNPRSRPISPRSSVFWRMGEDIPIFLKIVLWTISIALPLLVWWLITSIGIIDPRLFPWLFPSPLQTLLAFIELLQRGDLWLNMSATLIRVGVGFLLATLFSMPLVVLIVAFASIRALLLPFLSLLRYIPARTTIMLLVMGLGIDETPKIMIVFIGTLLFNVLIAIDTVEPVPRGLIDSTIALGGNRISILFQVVFPYVLPSILRACRISFTVAWQLVVISELISSMMGLGHRLHTSARFRQTDEVFALSIIMGMVGVAIDQLIKYLIDLFCNRSRQQPAAAD
jgi:NitT/TauT family transport system permease protein